MTESNPISISSSGPNERDTRSSSSVELIGTWKIEKELSSTDSVDVIIPTNFKKNGKEKDKPSEEMIDFSNFDKFLSQNEKKDKKKKKKKKKKDKKKKVRKKKDKKTRKKYYFNGEFFNDLGLKICGAKIRNFPSYDYHPCPRLPTGSSAFCPFHDTNTRYSRTFKESEVDYIRNVVKCSKVSEIPDHSKESHDEEESEITDMKSSRNTEEHVLEISVGDPKNMTIHQLKVEFEYLSTQSQNFDIKLLNASIASVQDPLAGLEKLKIESNLRLIKFRKELVQSELVNRIESGMSESANQKLSREVTENKRYSTIYGFVLGLNEVVEKKVGKELVDVRNVDIFSRDPSTEGCKTSILSLWGNLARYPPDGIVTGNFFRITEAKRMIYQGRNSYRPTKKSVISINPKDDLSFINQLRLELQNKSMGGGSFGGRKAKAFAKDLEPRVEKGRSFGGGKIFAKDLEPTSPSLPSQPGRPSQFAITAKKLFSKFQREDDQFLGKYRGHVEERDSKFLNSSLEPVCFRLDPFSTEEKKEIWRTANQFYDEMGGNISTERLSRIPILGGVYILGYPCEGSFNNISGSGTYVQNPSHVYAKCTDMPPLKRGGQTTRIFNVDGANVANRDYKYENCTNFVITIMEQCEKKDPTKPRSIYISRGERFYIVHAHGTRGCRKTGVSQIKVSFNPEKACRSNPLVRTKIERKSELGTVRESIRVVKNETVIRGPADTNITSGSVHANRSRRVKNHDPIGRVLSMLKSPNGVKFVQNVNPNHSKGGLEVFCSQPLTWVLYKALSPLFVNETKIAFNDSSFRFGKSKVSYPLLRFSCCDPPAHLSGGFFVHQHLDEESFENMGRCVVDMIKASNGDVGGIPDINLRDRDCAFIKGYIGFLKKTLEEEEPGKVTVDIDCLWHMIIQNIIDNPKFTKLIPQKKKGVLKKRCYDLFGKDTVSEFDEELPGFISFLQEEISVKKLTDYIQKNKIPQARERILKLAQASQSLKTDLNNIPDYNHPIEGSHTWYKNGIFVDDSIDVVVVKLGKKSEGKVFDLLRCCMGLPSEYRFSDDVTSRLKEDPEFKDFRRNVLASFFNAGTLEEQRRISNGISQALPGILSKHGLPEARKGRYKFNDEKLWKIKKLPVDISTFNLEYPNGKEAAEKSILKYLNNSGSIIPISKWKSMVYSEKHGEHVPVTVKEDHLSCDICGIVNEGCQHSILHGIIAQATDILQKSLKTPPNFRSLFPELKVRKGEKKSFRKKKSEGKRVVKEFPLVSQLKKVFVGYSQGASLDGSLGPSILLFESSKHKGRVVLCKENLSYYMKRGDIMKLAESCGVKGRSKMKVDELRSAVFDKLSIVAKEKCVFCQDGTLGFCCESNSCVAKSILMMRKRIEDVDVVSLIHRQIGISCDDLSIKESYLEELELLDRVLSCFGSLGQLVDLHKFRKFLYTLLSRVNLIQAIQLEEEFCGILLSRLGFIYDLDTPADGNCQYWFCSQQMSLFGIYMSPKFIKDGAIDFLRKNCDLKYGTGVNSTSIADDFGGKELFLKKIDELSREGVYGEEVTLLGIICFLQVLSNICHSDPNFENPWRRYSCEDYGIVAKVDMNGNKICLIGMFLAIKQHYQSLVRADSKLRTKMSHDEYCLNLRKEEKTIWKEAMKHYKEKGGVRKSRKLEDGKVCDEGCDTCHSCTLEFASDNNKGRCECGKLCHKSKPEGASVRCLMPCSDGVQRCQDCYSGYRK